MWRYCGKTLHHLYVRVSREDTMNMEFKLTLYCVKCKVKKAFSEQFRNMMNDLNYNECRYMQISTVITMKKLIIHSQSTIHNYGVNNIFLT